MAYSCAEAMEQKKADRSELMRRIKSQNTGPERQVRSLLHRQGFRFRLHCRDLPGTPDIVLRKYRTVVFVHGCFWHRHQCCAFTFTPKTNRPYWMPKFNRTVQRDRENMLALESMGWRVIVIWSCELRRPEELSGRLRQLLLTGQTRKG